MPFSRRELLAGALAAGGAAIARRAFGETPPPAKPHALVIDTHAHYYPADWVALVQKEGPANGAKIGKNDRGAATFSVPGIDAFFAPPYIDLDIRLKRMEAAGVDIHALSLTSPMVYWAPAGFGQKLSQVYNDAASAAHVKYPKRFVAMATLPMQAPELALKELERAAKLPGMRGLYLGTNVAGKNLDEEEFLPVFAKADELGWPVFLHPVDPVGADRMTSSAIPTIRGSRRPRSSSAA